MTYRNPKLLRLAKDSPHCMRCGKHNAGDVVAAHSNQMRDGKAKSLKASDAAIAYLCYACHMEIDQGARMSRAERVEEWEAAHRATLRWLIETERLVVNAS